MYNEIESKSFGTDEEQPASRIAPGNRIEALRSLAMLLLREVEALSDASISYLPQKNGGRLNLSKEMERYEIEMIRAAIIRANGKQTDAAAILGTKVTTLHEKIKRFGLGRYIDMSKLETVGYTNETGSTE